MHYIIFCVGASENVNYNKASRNTSLSLSNENYRLRTLWITPLSSAIMCFWNEPMLCFLLKFSIYMLNKASENRRSQTAVMKAVGSYRTALCLSCSNVRLTSSASCRGSGPFRPSCCGDLWRSSGLGFCTHFKPGDLQTAAVLPHHHQV